MARIFQTLDNGESLQETMSFQEISSSTNPSFCFRLNAISACSDLRIQGAPQCFDNPIAVTPSFENAYATYTEGGIELQLGTLPPGIFSGSRTIIGFGAEELDTLFSGYIDRNISNFRQFQYSILFSDTCQNELTPEVIAPSFIDPLEVSTNELEIQWAPAINTLTGSFTQQLRISGSNGSSRVISNPTNPITVLLQESQGIRQFIQLETVYQEQELTIFSNSRPFNYEFVAYLPDAFTPDGDGLNDELILLGIEAREVDFKIYNRWGEVIHVSQSPLSLWNGKVGGRRAPTGTYTYELTFMNIENELIQQRGSFVLLRK